MVKKRKKRTVKQGFDLAISKSNTARTRAQTSKVKAQSKLIQSHAKLELKRAGTVKAKSMRERNIESDRSKNKMSRIRESQRGTMAYQKGVLAQTKAEDKGMLQNTRALGKTKKDELSQENKLASTALQQSKHNFRVSEAARKRRAITKKKVDTWLKKKYTVRKILRKGPRPVLDLRARPEREVPVKQHGFKEDEISHTTVLGQ